MKAPRLVIYPKDIQIITGKSYSHALKLLNAMRKAFNKGHNHAITLDEFSAFMGIEEKKIVFFLFGEEIK